MSTTALRQGTWPASGAVCSWVGDRSRPGGPARAHSGGCHHDRRVDSSKLRHSTGSASVQHLVMLCNNALKDPESGSGTQHLVTCPAPARSHSLQMIRVPGSQERSRAANRLSGASANPPPRHRRVRAPDWLFVLPQPCHVGLPPGQHAARAALRPEPYPFAGPPDRVVRHILHEHRPGLNRPGFRAYFLSWEGCHVDASQVQPGHEGQGYPAGPRVYRPGSEPYVTSAEPSPGSVPDWLTPRARDVRHVRLRPEKADLRRSPRSCLFLADLLIWPWRTCTRRETAGHRDVDLEAVGKSEHAAAYESEYAAITAVAGRLGMSAETLRKWIRRAEVDQGQAPGVTSGAAREIRIHRRSQRRRDPLPLSRQQNSDPVDSGTGSHRST